MRTPGNLIAENTFGRLYGVKLTEGGEKMVVFSTVDGIISEANRNHIIACWNLVEDFGGDPAKVRAVIEELEKYCRGQYCLFCDKELPRVRAGAGCDRGG